MNVVADYHTHTRYSHGKGTILENVQAAAAAGLSGIAIADHGFAHIGFGISLRDLPMMKAEIQQARIQFPQLEILLGVEANLTGLGGEIDIPDALLPEFDILLMGFHKAVWPHSLRDGVQLFGRNALGALNPFQGDALRKTNTQAMIRAIERYPIRILTHPGAKIDIDSKLLAEAAAARGTALEINASHGRMSPAYVKIALAAGARFAISSDAHHPSRVGDFQRALQIADAAGVPPERIINAAGP